jgi:hypothetical protein
LVLGTGCAKCNQLYAAAEQAAKEAGVAYELNKAGIGRNTIRRAEYESRTEQNHSAGKRE